MVALDQMSIKIYLSSTKIMKNLNAKQKQWLITVHVAFAAMWFGTALSMIAIALMNRNTTNGDELYAINSVMKLYSETRFFKKLGFDIFIN